MCAQFVQVEAAWLAAGPSNTLENAPEDLSKNVPEAVQRLMDAWHQDDARGLFAVCLPYTLSLAYHA